MSVYIFVGEETFFLVDLDEHENYIRPLTHTPLHTHSLTHAHTSDDIKRRRKHYVNDWTVAFQKKGQVIPAILFLYFACLSPAVSFGTIANQITNGSIGIVEFLLSSGLSGMVSLAPSRHKTRSARFVRILFPHISHYHTILLHRHMPLCVVNPWLSLLPQD